jgi:hypothetical protein
MSTIQCTQHSAASTVQATWGHATLWYLRYEAEWCWWESKSFGLLHYVSALVVPNTLQVTWTFKTLGTTYQVHSITSRSPKFSLIHLLRAHGILFHKSGIKYSEGFTIVFCTNYNVRVLECCTTMWLPTIGHFCCQHHEWAYKQPWYLTL